jgi:hypothetical protein
MINLIKLITLLFTILFFQSALVSSASDIDELISMYDSSQCRYCHDDIAPGWEHSSHSKSVINPDVIKAVNSTIAKSAKTESRSTIKKCFSCHAPQISSASDSLIDHIADLIIIAGNDKNEKKKNKAQGKLSQLNLNCRICHMIKSMPQDRKDSNIIWGPGWDEHEKSHFDEYGFDTLKSDYLTSAQFCKNCHNSYDHQLTGSDKVVSQVKCVENNANKMNCQDCHIDIDHSFSMVKPTAQ